MSAFIQKKLAPYIRDFRCINCGEPVQPFYGEKNDWTHTDSAYAVSGRCRDPQADSQDINERLAELTREIERLKAENAGLRMDGMLK